MAAPKKNSNGSEPVADRQRRKRLLDKLQAEGDRIVKMEERHAKELASAHSSRATAMLAAKNAGASTFELEAASGLSAASVYRLVGLAKQGSL